MAELNRSNWKRCNRKMSDQVQYNQLNSGSSSHVNNHDLNIVLTTDKPGCANSTNEIGSSFKLYACSVCSSFSIKYEEIWNHVRTCHSVPENHITAKVLEISPGSLPDASNLNVMVVPKNSVSNSDEAISMELTWLCDCCNAEFNSQSERGNHICDINQQQIYENHDDVNNFSDMASTGIAAGIPDFSDLDTEETMEDQIPVKPIFSTENDQHIFESSLANINWNFADSMFKTLSSANQQCCIYQCLTCSKAFQIESHVRLHCLTHTTLKPFKCKQCEFCCATKSNLLAHMREHTGNMYECPKCSFKCTSRPRLFNHFKTHVTSKIRCELCGDFYHSSKSLVHHVRRTHCDLEKGHQYLTTILNKDKRNVLFQCHLCHKYFKNIREKNSHVQSHSCGIRTYDCKFCSYKGSSLLYLRNHIQKHWILYFCAFCDTVELSSINLKQHLKDHLEHTGEQDPPHGSQSFQQKTTALFEICVTKSWYLPDSCKSKQVPDKTPPIHTLADISANQIDQSLLTTNPIKALNYKQLSREILTKIRESCGNNECNVCGQLFPSSVLLDRHFFVHISDKPFKCASCEYSSSTKENLKRHEEVVHDRRRTYKCSHCNLQFENSHELNYHIASNHSEFVNTQPVHNDVNVHLMQNCLNQSSSPVTAQFSCKYCSYNSSTYTDFVAHISAHNTKDGSQATSTAIDQVYQQHTGPLEKSLIESSTSCEDLNKSSQLLSADRDENQAAAAQIMLEVSLPVLDEQTAVQLIQQVVQQRSMMNVEAATFADMNTEQTFIVSDASNEGKKFVIQYVADDANK